jgi:hypothetical protein
MAFFFIKLPKIGKNTNAPRFLELHPTPRGMHRSEACFAHPTPSGKFQIPKPKHQVGIWNLVLGI